MATVVPLPGKAKLHLVYMHHAMNDEIEQSFYELHDLICEFQIVATTYGLSFAFVEIQKEALLPVCGDNTIFVVSLQYHSP